MVIHESKRSWVEFEQVGAKNYSSENETSKGRMRSSQHSSSSRGGSAWMREPIQTNDSWVPMEVPGREPPASAAGGLRPPSPSMKGRSSSRSMREGSSRGRAAESNTPTKGPQPMIIRSGHENVPHRGGSRPPSRERSHRESSVRPPSRGRSDSRSQNLPEKRERSVSQPRSVGGASHTSHKSHRSNHDQNVNPNAKQRGRSRPPVTARNPPPKEISARGRSRSGSRARTARSRSASITRVTGPDTRVAGQERSHPPRSPSMRSVKSASNKSTSNRSAPDKSRHGAPQGRQPSRSSQGHAHSDDDLDPNIGRDISLGATNGMNGSVCSADSVRKKGLVGKLFGEQQQKGGRKGDSGMGEQIRSRVLLAATVYHNTATGLWITTINTNQKGVARDPKVANKYLKAFSFPSEQEARESAIANAPPKMVPFGEAQECFLCKNAFTVFKRACHCRNCGVCVCKDCSVSWHAKMIPETYNIKNEAVVKVCRSCNTISKAFRRAITQGDFDGALALYGTGNVNLRTPFPVETKKDEVIWPIHCAVEGGNINILRWLVDDHFCPITTIPSGARKARRGCPESLILTSAGRHALGIAIENLKVEIMQYLVVDKGISIYESKELELSLRALEATLHALPRVSDPREPVDDDAEPRWDSGSFDDMSIPSTIGVESAKQGHQLQDDTATVGSRTTTKNSDCCIICFDRKIDCVATPCGHQICCLECSSNLSSCPVCNHKGDFIRIFRP